MNRINPAFGLVGNQSLIYVLRFTASERIAELSVEQVDVRALYC